MVPAPLAEYKITREARPRGELPPSTPAHTRVNQSNILTKTILMAPLPSLKPPPQGRIIAYMPIKGQV